VSLADLEGALRLVVPGFVALKVFSLLALRSRRTDLELTLWSLLVAVFIDATVSHFSPSDDLIRLVEACALGGVLGIGSALGWRALSGRFRSLRATLSRSAWDAVLAQPQWVQIWLNDGHVIFGHPTVIANSAETDDLDVYVEDPQWVDATTGARSPMAGVAGVYLPATSISFVQLQGPGTPEGVNN
jgi:hypothetical protein